MKKRCHACYEKILSEAKICLHCNSSQNKFIYSINSFVGPTSIIISLISVVVSFFALYFSQVEEPASPQLVVQADRFGETEFSFWVTNLGKLPTVVRDFALKIKLVEGTGEHIVNAVFSIPPKEIPPGGNRFFEVDYSSYLRDHSEWTTDGELQSPFSLGFLYTAAGLGSNLHCEISVYYTSRRYFPHNTEGSSGSVNSTCTGSMEWFAKNIGPLKNKNISK